MNEKILNRSISWMFAALLLILSFIRGPIQAWMLAAVFAAWVIYLAARLLLPRVKVWFAKRKGTDKRPKKRRAVKKQRDIPVPEETPSVLVEGSELERLLLGHISCRISEKLKSAYPQATWQWCSPRPVSIIRGGTGRIRTFNTEDYTHAEVTVGEYFKIAFKMMKIDFGTVSGMLCGSMANPMALNYANDTIPGDNPSVAYATVYPLCMFLRVIIAQVLLMFFLG